MKNQIISYLFFSFIVVFRALEDIDTVKADQLDQNNSQLGPCFVVKVSDSSSAPTGRRKELPVPSMSY